jgi:HPt (histidine-containing phosphotransfer) domain-containing protein
VASIVAAVELGDLSQVSDLNHKLKSAARSVGAMQLGETCEALEQAGRAGDQAECAKLAAHLHRLFEQTDEAIQRELARDSD